MVLHSLMSTEKPGRQLLRVIALNNTCLLKIKTISSNNVQTLLKCSTLAGYLAICIPALLSSVVIRSLVLGTMVNFQGKLLTPQVCSPFLALPHCSITC